MRPTLILETTAYTPEQIIHLQQAQLALAGRSNVGKSSLVNALAERKALAKVSATPGKTRSINFYRVEPDNFYIVDLPGYGYARCSQKERNAWGKMLEQYLVECAQLRALVLLLDCRLPAQKSDVALAHFAQTHQIPLLPVLTKADKCTQKEHAQRQQEWKILLSGVVPLITSAKSRNGVAALWEALRKAAAN